MSFDPAKYLQEKTAKTSGFDPSQYLAEKTQVETKPEPGAAEAAIAGFGKGATLGYLPQIQAMTQPITDRVLNALPGPDAEPAPFSQMIPGSPEYIAARDSFSKSAAKQAEKFPKASLAGNVAGVLATSLVPGAAIASQGAKASIGATALKGIATGAAEAAAMNPGDVEGEFNPMQTAERWDNAKLGALFGGLGGAAAGTMAKVASGAKNAAESLAFKSSGAMLKDYRAVSSRGKVNDLGRFMLDRVLKAGDTFDDVAAKTKAIKAESGQEIGRLYKGVLEQIGDEKTWANLPPAQKSALAMTGFKPKAQKADIVAAIQEKLGDSPNRKAAMSFVNDYLDDLAEKYGNDLDIVRANAIKGDIDGAITYSKRAQDLPEKEQALSTLRNYIRDRIEEHIGELDKIVGGDQVKQLREANKVFGAASEIEHIAFDRVQRESANRFFSLGDRINGAASATTGGVAGALLGGDAESALKGAALGLGGAMASRAARKYGTHALARTADLAAKGGGLSSIPATLGSAVAKGSASPKFTPADPATQQKPIIGHDTKPDTKTAAAPARGEEKWARDGLSKLGLSESPEAMKIMSDPKGRRLLIEASDLLPGSKAMQRVRDQIREGWGVKWQ